MSTAMLIALIGVACGIVAGLVVWRRCSSSKPARRLAQLSIRRRAAPRPVAVVSTATARCDSALSI